MAAPNLRAIRDWVNKKIGVIDTSISNTNKNVTRVTSDVESVQESVKIDGRQVYLDVRDGVYGFNTQPERGADTFTPFKSGSSEGGGSSGSGFTSPLQYKIVVNNTGSEAGNTLIHFYLPSNIKLIKYVVNGKIKIKKSSTGGSSLSLQVGDNYGSHNVDYVIAYSDSTEEAVKEIVNKIVDFSGKKFQYFKVSIIPSSNTDKSFSYSVDLTIDVYF